MDCQKLMLVTICCRGKPITVLMSCSHMIVCLCTRLTDIPEMGNSRDGAVWYFELVLEKYETLCGGWGELKGWMVPFMKFLKTLQGIIVCVNQDPF